MKFRIAIYAVSIFLVTFAQARSKTLGLIGVSGGLHTNETTDTFMGSTNFAAHLGAQKSLINFINFQYLIEGDFTLGTLNFNGTDLGFNKFGVGVVFGITIDSFPSNSISPFIGANGIVGADLLFSDGELLPQQSVSMRYGYELTAGVTLGSKKSKYIFTAFYRDQINKVSSRDVISDLFGGRVSYAF